jgi:ferredoxin
VEVSPSTSISPMRGDEEALLKRMNLPLDGTIRLSCQSRIVGDVSIDISFQDKYSPDDGD